MNGRRRFLTVCACLWLAGVARGGAEEVTALLKMVPADLPVSVVVTNLAGADETVRALAKRLAPSEQAAGPLADFKKEVDVARAIGEWIEYDKPMAMAMSSVEDDEFTLFWVTAPKFKKIAKGMEGATRDGDLWGITVGEGEDAKRMHMLMVGDYVVAAYDGALLSRVRQVKRSLADVAAARPRVFGGRDVIVHVAMEPLRSKALGGLASVSQMVPMIAMMAGPQTGADPMALTQMLTGMFEAGTKFVEQLAYVDVGLTVSGSAIDVTIATGYKDGPIKAYLGKQKPATLEFFTEIEDQPYFMAAGYHVPGDSSPFFDFMFEKMLAGATKPAGAAAGEGAPATGAADASAAAETLKLSKEAYRRIEGANVLISFGSKGISELGDLVGRDPAAILELSKKMLLSANPMMKQFGFGGAKYEALEAKKIGDVDVSTFAMRFDETDPAMAQLTTIYGKDLRLGFGIAGERVRFFLGGEDLLQRAFKRSVSKPFSAAPFVKQVLAALPKERNAVILLDLATLIPAIGAMSGGAPAGASVPPGPPIAVSASLASHPATVDIHVPIRAIERIMQASAPEEPM